ncbi:MAG: TonB-dependent receptor [Candidatus Baltobacteraceae bacterium]
MRSSIARARASCAFILTALFMLSSFGAVRAQSAAFDVTGTVSSADGSPIAGAAVTISSQSGTQRARTDARGSFTIAGVRAGTYTLRAAAPGYAPLSERTVTLDPRNATLAVVLSAATTNSLTVIGRVTAQAGETVSTSSAPTVSLNAQQAAAAGMSSVAPMVWSQLSTTPVLPLGGGSNATEVFAVRGPDPTETLVDIDGHPVNNGNTGDFNLALLDPAALQDVQVVYGISPSSLIGPNTIGGGINVLTLQPTQTPHALARLYGGSFGTFGGTLQATGTDDRIGYAFSVHGMTSGGSVNQTILAPSLSPSSDDQSEQFVGSSSSGDSILTKLRYQLGGPNGYGYVQLNFRNQTVTQDESALLTTYTPPGFSGSGGDDAVRLHGGLAPLDDDDDNPGGFQSFAGTALGAHQSNYGLDAQVPLGSQLVDGAPATALLFSHLTTLSSQSVAGPGEAANPYLYNQRDLLGDDWLEIDHRFSNGVLSLKYDLGTETLATNYVQSQVIAEAQPIGRLPFPGSWISADALVQPLAKPPVQTVDIAQTQRNAVLRYNADPTSQIHYSLAAYYSNYSTFGTSFDPRAGFVWTPTGNTAVRASVGTTFQTPQLSELLVPPVDARVPVGGIIYIGNPNLQPDHATDYDVGAEQIFGRRHPLHLSMDLYQTNLRAPSSQLNVNPNPHCQTKHNPTACPLSYPVNAGNGIYRGIDIHADQQIGADFRIRAGWDVDSSFLTVIPESIQDGTLVIGEQSLGQPLHKAYFEIGQEPLQGLSYGARLDYEGQYNELNRSPYATLGAHVAYRRGGLVYGLYGTNLTNANAYPFTIVGGGVPYGTLPGQPIITPNAYVLQGATITFVVTQAM